MTMPRVIDSRVVLSLSVSAVAGALGLHQYPFPGDHGVLALIHVVRPALYAGFVYAYASLWCRRSFRTA
jgi:hypothetical protein